LISNLQSSKTPARDLNERIARLSPAKRALLDLRAKKQNVSTLDGKNILRRKNNSVAPLSFAQQRLWFLNQFEPNSPYYNIPVAWCLVGVLNVEALRKSFNEIVRRHEALRTTFAKRNGDAVQIVAPALNLTVPLLDLTDREPDLRQAEASRLIAEEAQRSFDLSKGPLVRCMLIRLDKEEHLLLLTLHHIISDGWSMNIIYRELGALYEAFSQGQPSPLPDLPIQYADFADWQRKRLPDDALDKHLSYWKDQLTGVPAVLRLPADRPRPAVQNFKGACHTAMLPVSLSEGLKSLARGEGATLFMVLLAAFQVLLYRYSGQEEIVVGSPVAGRNHSEIENLIGFFVNTLALHANFSNNPTFREMLGRVREIIIGGYDHQDLPFERLVEEMHPERDLSYSPVFQVMFALENELEEHPKLSLLTLTPLRVDASASQFDLTLFIDEKATGLAARVIYSTDLFDQATIARLLGHFQILLEGIVANPDEYIVKLPLLSESERRQIIVEWNDTASDYRQNLCVHQLFDIQAEKTPDSVAVEFGNENITYGELRSRSNQLAHYLRSLGVGPDVLVAISVERSIAMVIGMLGILKSGGAYVPLDPSYPRERLDVMLTEMRTPVLLTQQRFVDRMSHPKDEIFCLDSDWESIADLSGESPAFKMTSDNLAYIIYTSGSTGRPKGACIPHRAIMRLVLNTDYITLMPSDRIAQASNSSFDAATFEIWGALLNGACLVELTKDELLSSQKFAAKIRKKNISVLFLTTALFNKLSAEVPQAFSSLKFLLFGGEAVDPKWVKAVLNHGAPHRLIHVYGPTENTTFSTWYPVKDVTEEATTIPIGKPISNTQCYILDKHLQAVPPGIPGELYLGGDGLAWGYYKRPEVTSEKFIRNPFRETAGTSLYKTGDLARYLPNGDIEFLGRIDNQVKLRGFRIELDEIEVVLKQHSTVNDSVVIMREDSPGEKRIVAYIVFDHQNRLDIKELRAFIQSKLPEYMVPSAFVVLNTLPLTPNGKVDRKMLPLPNQMQALSNNNFLAPRDAVERQLASIWKKALGLHSVGIRDKFFDIGGHSLLAVQVLSKINQWAGKEIPLAELFRSPTIEQLAGIIRQKEWSSQFFWVLPFQPYGSKPPFFCIHGGAAELANHLGLDQPFYGAMPHGYDGRLFPPEVREMAAGYIKEIRMIQPEGPYFLGGYSFGGLVAFEIAQQLKTEGEEIGMLAMIDPTIAGNCTKFPKNSPGCEPPLPKWVQFHSYIIRICKHFVCLDPLEKVNYIWAGVLGRIFRKAWIEKKWKALVCKFFIRFSHPVPQKYRIFFRGRIFKRSAREYRPQKYAGRAVLFQLIDNTYNPQLFWKEYMAEGLEVYEIPGTHEEIFEKPQVRSLAEKFESCLIRAQKNSQLHP
jgi:amino acid adenylation domain-containing protein